jgi:hypothetical protein
MENLQINVNEEDQGLLADEWKEVSRLLGKERAVKLMQNGTTPDVARQIARLMEDKEKLFKLF